MDVVIESEDGALVGSTIDTIATEVGVITDVD